jgi:putative transcriptional regulator
VLEAVAAGDGPQRMLVSISCAGWSRASSENQPQRLAHRQRRPLFDLPIEQRYTAAIKLLGIDPLMLAPGAGHA